MQDKLLSHEVLLSGISFGDTIFGLIAVGVLLWIVRPWGGTDSKGLSHGSVERLFMFLFVFLAFGILLAIFWR